MGFIGRIKNILFEPDDEEIVEDMPVYTKEEVKKEEVINEEVTGPVPVIPEEPPIKTTNTSHFSNVKRDIDIDYEDKKVLDEVPGGMEAMKSAVVDQAKVVPKVEEKRPSPFQSFDEKEFERVNSRVVRNVEHKPQQVQQPANNFRKANNFFSSTSTGEIKLEEEHVEPVRVGKKPFTPSPVISPVYGILDKNYTKDDIVDKKDGMKREKIVKTKEKDEEKEEPEVHVNIDSVRQKAYGTLEDIEVEMDTPVEVPHDDIEITDNDIVIEDIKPDVIETEEEPVVETDIDFSEIDENLTLGDLINSQNNMNETKTEEVSVEDELENEFDDTTEESFEIKEPVVEEVEESSKGEEQPVRPRLLDDMEKTSTLQILDDIEKELNSIKPIAKDVKTYDEEEMKEKIEKSETLENDLFNLIDSMYEQGEED